MAHSVSTHTEKKKKKGFAEFSKSEMLASECDPEGKKKAGWGNMGKALSVAPDVEKAETCLRTW